jgi:hypothetical protein
MKTSLVLIILASIGLAVALLTAGTYFWLGMAIAGGSLALGLTAIKIRDTESFF